MGVGFRDRILIAILDVFRIVCLLNAEFVIISKHLIDPHIHIPTHACDSFPVTHRIGQCEKEICRANGRVVHMEGGIIKDRMILLVGIVEDLMHGGWLIIVSAG